MIRLIILGHFIIESLYHSTIVTYICKKKEYMNLCIIFGGRSAEYTISLRSAKNVIKSTDKSKYTLTLIGITKEGDWKLFDTEQKSEEIATKDQLTLSNPIGDVQLTLAKEAAFVVPDKGIHIRPDVVFPVLHGPFGEDGTIQGMLRMANLPFVGPDVLGSAVAMDKEIMKRLLRDAGLPIGKFITLYKEDERPSFEEVKATVGMPVFIKPANLGSSVGINKARTGEELAKSIEIAFDFDTKIIVEESMNIREIECAILGNHNAKASMPGEITSHKEFYSFDAKYIDQQASSCEIPANISPELQEKVKDYALQTFKILNCEGLSRVDIFLNDKNELYINEINTIPGFTSISMYPMMWKEEGIEYSELIDQLIHYAIDRFKKKSRLKVEI